MRAKPDGFRVMPFGGSLWLVKVYRAGLPVEDHLLSKAEVAEIRRDAKFYGVPEYWWPIP